jgi:hypothetical protein
MDRGFPLFMKAMLVATGKQPFPSEFSAWSEMPAGGCKKFEGITSCKAAHIDEMNTRKVVKIAIVEAILKYSTKFIGCEN